MNAKITIGVTLLVLVVIFTLQNVEVVQIDFLIWSFKVSRALMVFVVFSVGVVIGAFAGNHYK